MEIMTAILEDQRSFSMGGLNEKDRGLSEVINGLPSLSEFAEDTKKEIRPISWFHSQCPLELSITDTIEHIWSYHYSTYDITGTECLYLDHISYDQKFSEWIGGNTHE